MSITQGALYPASYSPNGAFIGGVDQYNSYNPLLANPTSNVGPLHLATTNPLAAGIKNVGDAVSQGIASLDQDLNSLITPQAPAGSVQSGFTQFETFILLALGLVGVAYVIGQGEHHR